MKKILIALSISLFTQLAIADPSCSQYAYNNVLPKSTAPVTVLCKQDFAIGYSEQKHTLLWVAEKIDPTEINGIFLKKRPPFHQDKTVPKDEQSDNKDFARSGYDKGHMVPFEDMAFSKDTAYDVMSLTNIVPQNPNNNRGSWKSLEELARKKGSKDVLFVVSGPIYQGTIKTIGKDQVPVPTALFKVMIDPSEKTAETWILPNAPVTKQQLSGDVSTRAQVMQEAGVDVTPGAQLTDIK